MTKLYNEEMHVIASKSIRSLKELDGKTVSVDLPNGGTFVTASIVFERLGLKPKLVYIEQRIALEKLKAGEIDAVVAVQGKPSKAVSQIKDDRLHLVPVDYAKPLQGDYLPASLSAKDYPNLISDQGQVDTIAVPAVLAAYNWAPNTERYRKLALFVDKFFTKFPTFQNPPFHPKWKEVSLSAPLPDWQRFPAAKTWLDERKIEPVARSRFDDFLKQKTVSREAAFRRRKGSAVQAVPGMGSRAECAGAGPAGTRSRDSPAGLKRSGFGLVAIGSLTVEPRCNAARAASRCSGVMWLATIRIAVASTAASSVKPSNGSMSGAKSNGRMK